jgi:HEAT repeat protein
MMQKSTDELLSSVRKVQSKMVTPPAIDDLNLEALSPLERMLIEQLGDGAMSLLEAAAKTIQERQVLVAVPALSKMLSNAPWGSGLVDDSDRDAGIEAIMALAPEKTGEAIRGALSSTQWKVRYWAVQPLLFGIKSSTLCLPLRSVS